MATQPRNSSLVDLVDSVDFTDSTEKMSPSAGLGSPLKIVSLLGAIILAAIPLHAFVTVWSSTLLGHYTVLRLWKEALLLVIAALVITDIIRQRKQRGGNSGKFTRFPLWLWLICAYIGVLLIGAVVGYESHGVNLKAAAYGLLVDSRFLVFFAVMRYAATRTSYASHAAADHRPSNLIFRNWQRLLLAPASIVVVFGLLQFLVLPADFLSHFGYGPHTIVATQTVDQKLTYQRVQSTLRGANPFGAYLIIVITGLLVLGHRAPGKRRVIYVGALLVAGLVLLATFSRSAWLGVLAAALSLVWLAVRSVRLKRWLTTGACAALLLAASLGYGLRNNDVVQNTFLHTDEHSRSAASSNQGHIAATSMGLRDIISRPLGSGTGTAGPASVYNTAPARIAENYYIQIGQEIGVVGLGLFIAIMIVVGRSLWQFRSQPLAQLLLASLIGISVVNLLSHAWTDDTLAYLWWGLAGVALGTFGTVGTIEALEFTKHTRRELSNEYETKTKI